ncbi:hypothetical protein DVH26_19930 [Paenibacillus sp. H1-7]|uniref:metallophosphoesterase n=1 Tax=Paenibacillus sp. H1-7 TaxID=2282849 RepID=UPI001EF78601|nr:metallophosphoesterase [Paenibacillus sp. H1-7]ULL16510.1 hypothetical protein DVH26_19930 [Paenibacillus sp. H1-7]
MDAVTLSHKELPESFDGYEILQISDLIEKTFGSEQNVLINLIRKQEYDVVLFTGDYIEDDSDNLIPLEDLLKGMPKGKEMYYILGDKDENNSITPLVSGNRFYDLCTLYGVKPLYPGQKITKNGQSIWLKTNPYPGITEIFDGNPSQELIDAKKAFDEEYNTTSDPFTIEVSHWPTDIDVEEDFVHDYVREF